MIAKQTHALHIHAVGTIASRTSLRKHWKEGFKLRSDVRSHKDRLQKAEWHEQEQGTACIWLVSTSWYSLSLKADFRVQGSPSTNTRIETTTRFVQLSYFSVTGSWSIRADLEAFSESSSMEDTRALQKPNVTAAKCISYLCACDSTLDTLTSVLKRFNIFVHDCRDSGLIFGKFSLRKCWNIYGNLWELSRVCHVKLKTLKFHWYRATRRDRPSWLY